MYFPRNILEQAPKTKGTVLAAECLSPRHWNVTRHIDRWHAGLGKPVADDISQYKGDMVLLMMWLCLCLSHGI